MPLRTSSLTLALLLAGCATPERRGAALTPIRDAAGRTVGYVQPVSGQASVIRAADMTAQGTVAVGADGALVLRDRSGRVVPAVALRGDR